MEYGHLIVPNLELANTLIYEWQKTWNKKTKLTVSYAQHKRRIENMEKDLIEEVKYGSKIFTDPNKNRKAINK